MGNLVETKLPELTLCGAFKAPEMPETRQCQMILHTP